MSAQKNGSTTVAEKQNHFFIREGERFLFCPDLRKLYRVRNEDKDKNEPTQAGDISFPKNNRTTIVQNTQALLERRPVDDNIKTTSYKNKDVCDLELAVNQIALFITDDCNLRCIYCYENDRKCGKVGKQMNKEVARSAIDLLFLEMTKATSNKGRIMFSGGEPLLNWKVMRYVIEYTKERMLRENKTILFGVSTNGTILTKKKIDYLYKYGIDIDFSIDGPQNIHNRQRRFLNGTGSYERLMRNINYCFSLPIERHTISAKAVATHYSTGILATILHLQKIGFRRFSFVPAFIYPKTSLDPLGALTADDIKIMVEQYGLVAKYLVQQLLQGENIICDTFFPIIKRIYKGIKQCYGCSAGSKYVAISSEGYIYPCHKFIGMGDSEMGRVDQYEHFKILQREKHANYKIYVDNDDECASVLSHK